MHLLPTILNLTILSVASLGKTTHAFTLSPDNAIRTTLSRTRTTTTLSAVTNADAASIFGRLADRAYVPPPSDVQGTAASGYEFGVMEAGRPKWLCTYGERSGQTQGGGKMMTHVPNWKKLLFDGEDGVLEGKGRLKELLGDGELVKFQMPLSAPSGTKSVATEPPTDPAVDALWSLFGGSSENDGPLNAGDVSTALRETANANGSSTEDHFTFAVFEKAFLAAAGDGA